MQGNALRLFHFICIINKYCYFHLYETLVEETYLRLQQVLGGHIGIKADFVVTGRTETKQKSQACDVIYTFRIFISKQRTIVTIIENPFGNYSQSGH